MPTKRTPLHRDLQMRITPEVLAAFAEMERLAGECTCGPIDWTRYWERTPCSSCDLWWDAHSVLHDALDLPPHQWPGVRRPDAANPYPIGSFAAARWDRERVERPEAAELYVLLRRLLDEAERPKRAAKSRRRPHDVAR